jgi:hypothetical protein
MGRGFDPAPIFSNILNNVKNIGKKDLWFLIQNNLWEVKMKTEDIINALLEHSKDPDVLRMLAPYLNNRRIRKEALQTILDGDLPVQVPCGDSVRTVIIHRSGTITIKDHSDDEIKAMLVCRIFGQPLCSCLRLQKIVSEINFDPNRNARNWSNLVIKIARQLIGRVRQVPDRQVRERLTRLLRFIHILKVIRCDQKRFLDDPNYLAKYQTWRSVESKVYNLLTETRTFKYNPCVILKFKPEGAQFQNTPNNNYYCGSSAWKTTTVSIRSVYSQPEICIELGVDFIRLYNQNRWYCIDTSGVSLGYKRISPEFFQLTYPEGVKCLILAENPVKVKIQGKEFRDCLAFVPRRYAAAPQSFFKRVYVDENGYIAAFVQPYPKDALKPGGAHPYALPVSWDWTPVKKVSWVRPLKKTKTGGRK